MITDAEDMSAVLLACESVQPFKEVGMKWNFPVIGVLQTPDQNTFIVGIQIGHGKIQKFLGAGPGPKSEIDEQAISGVFDFKIRDDFFESFDFGRQKILVFIE
jgi:hypothetical protein